MMKLYDQTDFDRNAQEKGSSLRFALLCMASLFAVAIAAMALRIQWLCAAGCIGTGAVLIFLYDLRIKPALSYGAYLREANSGLSRETGGALVRIGSDPVFDNGVNFYEVIINIYEDMTEEGERRFLLDARKEIPQQWIGSDVMITSHGSYVIEIRKAEAKR